jgi:hypothetical protein
MGGNHVCQLLKQCIAAQPLSLLCLLDPENLCRLAGFLGTLGLLPCGDCLALPFLGPLLRQAGVFSGGKGGVFAALKLSAFAGLAFYLSAFAGLTLGLRTLGGFSGLATLGINGLLSDALITLGLLTSGTLGAEGLQLSLIGLLLAQSVAELQ